MEIMKEIDLCVKLQCSLNSMCKDKYSDSAIDYKVIIPRVKQAECLKLAAAECDIIACLPTGYGKSMIYEALPYVEEVFRNNTGSAVLVVTPLNAIIDDHLNRLGRAGVKVDGACDIFDDDKCKYFLGHPESILDSKLHSALLNGNAAKRIKWIVIDEAHCIKQWAEFRPMYNELSRLRALFPSANILALTATATPSTREEIATKLAMHHPVSVLSNGDRRNIFLEVKKMKPSCGGDNTAEESYMSVLDPLLTELENKGKDFPKTIVYCKLKWCGFAYDYCHRYMIDKPFMNMSLVSQYHAPCKDDMKTTVAALFRGIHLRLIFATEALGMGIDILDVRRIIHIGPPFSVETFYQEVGRAGRDGLKASSLVLYNASHISSNMKEMSAAIKEYCETLECRRLLLSQYFSYTYDVFQSGHLCCDNCAKKCTCEACGSLAAMCNACVQSVTIVDDKIVLMMKQLFRETNENYCQSSNSRLKPVLYTGLTDSLATNIAKNASKYITVDKILTDFPFIAIDTAQQIYHIVLQCTKSSSRPILCRKKLLLQEHFNSQ